MVSQKIKSNMPWTQKKYPPSMKNLPMAIRDKAVEIANALLEETKMPEGIVIATAISRAKDWGVHHGKKIKNDRVKSRSTDQKKHGEDRYVVPYKEDQWAVKAEGRKRAEKIFATKQQAVKTARKEAKEANAGLTIQKKSGKVQKRISYNPNKKGRRSKV
jgi:uncharacterized protein YdaT